MAARTYGTPDADPTAVVTDMIRGLFDSAVGTSEYRRVWQRKCGGIARRLSNTEFGPARLRRRRGESGEVGSAGAEINGI